MNYKQILACFLMSISINSIAMVPIKGAKKIFNITDLTRLLKKHGYEIISSDTEKFEAQKKDTYARSISHKDHPFLKKKEIIENNHYCKITQLKDSQNFFVELANEVSIKESLDAIFLSQEEEDLLIEESCSSDKETALVYSIERAIQVVVSLLRKK